MKEISGSDFGRFGQRELRKRLGSKKAISEHFKGIRKIQTEKRAALKRPDIVRGGAK